MACSSFIWRMEFLFSCCCVGGSSRRPHFVLWSMPAISCGRPLFRYSPPGHALRFFCSLFLFWRLPPTVGVCGRRWARLPPKSHCCGRRALLFCTCRWEGAVHCRGQG